VVVLTKNGGALLAESLAAIAAQRHAEPFEVVVIDSGSTDGTAERLAADSRVRLTRIAAADFQHGRTRNLAMRLATGELVMFLTQDAVPAGDGWLAAYVRFMQAHPEVAGAFGRQVPRPDADALEAWEVSRHFDSFRGGPVVFRGSTDRAAAQSVPERVRPHFFSNVNSCIRREAWQRVAFPEVDFGEDQAWAMEIHRSGVATGYVDEAVVMHSHDYGAWALFARRYDEARFMQRVFDCALSPSLRAAVGSAEKRVGMYRDYLVALGERRHVRWRAASRAWSSSLGEWAGARLAHRDGVVHRFLSLTERLRAA